jgi:hypothetical protein
VLRGILQCSAGKPVEVAQLNDIGVKNDEAADAEANQQEEDERPNPARADNPRGEPCKIRWPSLPKTRI